MTYYEYLIKKRDRLAYGLENRSIPMASWSKAYWTNVLKELDAEIANLTVEQAEKEMSW